MTNKTPGASRASGGKRPRRTFSPEYKHEAARLVIDTGRTIAEVARELNVGAQSLGKWVAAERAKEAGEPTGELPLDERAELKALRRQVAELGKDNEFLGKAAAFFASLANDRRTVRTDGGGEGELARLTRMARLLGVSRSGFYAWTTRQHAEPGPQRRGRDELDAKVRKVFAESDDVYGAPRVHAQLAREGTQVDRKTVAKSMLRQGLEGISEEEVHPGDHDCRCGRLQDP
jgi:transposase